MDLSALHTTLPGHSPQHSSAEAAAAAVSPDALLLQAFKDAAKSVTLLYKNSVSANTTSRQEGYHEALSDVLEVLDTEAAHNDPSFALVRLREWVIQQRRKRAPQREMSAESEDDVIRQREPQQQQQQQQQSDEYGNEEQNQQQGNQLEVPSFRSDIHNRSPASSHEASPAPSAKSLPALAYHQPVAQTVPQGPNLTGEIDIDFVHDDSQNTNSTAPQSGIFQFNSPATATPARVNNSTKQLFNGRQPLGNGAGNKRKFHLGDFFDIGGINGLGNGWNNNNNGGGGKRGRFI